MKLLTAIVLLIVLIGIGRAMFLSFRAQSPSDYAGAGPAFDMKTYLNGPILSEGLIFGPNGRMSSSFVAEMEGEWEGDSGTLTENFTYSTGRQQQRKWFLSLGENGAFTATADDIVGTAKGQVTGNTIKMKYRIVLPPEAGGQTLDVVDWLYLTDNGVIMNRSELHKFGIRVAELVATMRPLEAMEMKSDQAEAAQ